MEDGATFFPLDGLGGAAPAGGWLPRGLSSTGMRLSQSNRVDAVSVALTADRTRHSVQRDGVSSATAATMERFTGRST